VSLLISACRHRNEYFQSKGAWQSVDLEMGIYLNSLEMEDELFVWQQMSTPHFAGK